MSEFEHRTDDEIVERINEIRKADFFGFRTGDLVSYLPFEAAKQFLKEGADGVGWAVAERSREAVLKQMEDYMSFAWDKANNCRGLSASRTMGHYAAWLWMIKEDTGELAKLADNYEYYGKPQLVAICERFGWDHAQWDDGIRTNTDV